MGGTPIIQIIASLWKGLLFRGFAAGLPALAGSHQFNLMQQKDCNPTHIYPTVSNLPSHSSPGIYIPTTASSFRLYCPFRLWTSEENDQRLEKDLMETPMCREHMERLKRTKYYRKTFDMRRRWCNRIKYIRAAPTMADGWYLANKKTP